MSYLKLLKLLKLLAENVGDDGYVNCVITDCYFYPTKAFKPNNVILFLGEETKWFGLSVIKPKRVVLLGFELNESGISNCIFS